MKFLNWIKGVLKKREVSKLEPNKDFQFDEYFYFDNETEVKENFSFIYCNNYTDKFIDNEEEQLKYSFIHIMIQLPKTNKVLEDLINFTNIYYTKIYSDSVDYDTIITEITDSLVIINLRGNLLSYKEICDKIHNNIITKYIRNNLFPNELPIITPNQFLGNIYNSINYPSKEVDILFIEDKVFANKFSNVIGLSISRGKGIKNFNIDNKKYKIQNNRIIIYTEINRLSKEELDYLINNVKYGNKLLDIIHQSIDDDIDSDIDEIIEE